MTSYAVTCVSQISSSVDPFISNEHESKDLIEDVINFGGVFSNTKYAWLVNGATLKVINTRTSQEISCWVFGNILKDWTAKINCVEELPRIDYKFPLIVVGLKCILNRGMVCIFEFTGSKVLRAIEVPTEVTSIGIIDTGLNDCLLPGPLRAFDGAIAVGTAGGEVYLLDLCIEACEDAITAFRNIRDEANLCKMMELSLNNIPLLETYKQQSNRKSEHLSLRLNDVENEVRQVFVLKGPAGREHAHVNKVEVVISALHYCPQLGSLLIGYNFGAWQLWDLMQIKLLYTSSIFENNIPITHFAVQEPCDDPRAFCYVWAIYNNNERYMTGFPTAVMYALNYGSKEWHEGYGFLYEDLRSCSPRFQRELKLADNRDIKPTGGECLRCVSVNKGIAKANSPNESYEDACSCCFFIWNVWNKDGIVYTYLSLFDLNQWYKEQMPGFSQKEEEIDSSYVTTTCLSDVIKNVNQSKSIVLDVCVNTNSLNQFKGVTRLEEHYFPSSMSFDLCVLRENDVSLIKNKGSQKSLLFLMQSKGPLCFVEPTDLYQQCIKLGLTPLFTETLSPSSATLEYQREFLLSVALEQQLVGWLCKCGSSSSNGSFSSVGCSLSVLLKWGWQRANILKQNADNLCVPLFDYSGVKLDTNSTNLLNNCIRQLKNLKTFFKFVLRKFRVQLNNPEAIEKQYNSLEMVATYLEVIQWSFNVGLLPEAPLSFYQNLNQSDGLCAPYPVKTLTDYYNERRIHLNLLYQEHFSCKGSVLFIDNLIEYNGTAIQQEWKKDGGNGFYPPPSLQALMRTYLIENMDMNHKHCIVVYVFLDLAVNLNQEKYKSIITQLIKFPAVFQLTPSIIKITQAFWQLDHGDFSTTIEQLLDPLVKKEDLKMWHHRTVLRSFLLQGQHNYALLYLQVRQPPAADVQDLCTTISLYIANGMLDEAFNFQRQNKNDCNEAQLLQHFFKDCSKKSHLISILHLPLNPTEESHFMKYLEAVNHPQLEDFKIFYHLQRSRYVDAFKINNKLNEKTLESLGLAGKQRSNLRDFVIKSTFEHMPNISKKLSEFYRIQNSSISENDNNEKPLSLFVNDKMHNKVYKSNFLCATILKTSSLWLCDKNGDMRSSVCVTDSLPFFKTPTLSESHKRSAPPVIYPEEITIESTPDLEGPSSPKRRRLSPRTTVHSTEKEFPSVLAFDTPVIKRKEVRGKEVNTTIVDGTSYTPQSILKKKYKSNVNVDNRATPERLSDMESDDPDNTISIVETKKVLDYSHTPIKRFTLSPRKSILRSSRPSVHFESHASKIEPQDKIEANLINSPTLIVKPPTVNLLTRHRLSEKYNEINSITFDSNSKTSSPSTEDIFCTPENSFEELTNCNIIENNKVEEHEFENQNTEEDTADIDNNKLKKQTKILYTPKKRRSYKDISDVPIRSSPRLRRSVDKINVSSIPLEEVNKRQILTRRSTSKLPTVSKISNVLNNQPSKIDDEEKSYWKQELLQKTNPLSEKIVESLEKRTKNTAEKKISQSSKEGESIVEKKETITGKLKDDNVVTDELLRTEIEETKSNTKSIPIIDKGDNLKQIITVSKETKLNKGKGDVQTKLQDSNKQEDTGNYSDLPTVEGQQDLSEYSCNLDDNVEPVPSTSGLNIQLTTTAVTTTLTTDIYDNLSNDSTNFGAIDPRMNVFEMSDILECAFVEHEKELMDTEEIYGDNELETYNDNTTVFSVDTVDTNSNKTGGEEVTETTVEIIEINSSASESNNESDRLTPIISDPTSSDRSSSYSSTDESTTNEQKVRDTNNEYSDNEEIPLEIQSLNSDSGLFKRERSYSGDSNGSKSRSLKEMTEKEEVDLLLRRDEEKEHEIKPNLSNENIQSNKDSCENPTEQKQDIINEDLPVNLVSSKSNTTDESSENIESIEGNLASNEISEKDESTRNAKILKGKRRTPSLSVSSEDSEANSDKRMLFGSSLYKSADIVSKSKSELFESRKRKHQSAVSSETPSIVSLKSSRSSLANAVSDMPTRRLLRSRSIEAEIQTEMKEKVIAPVNKRKKSASVVSLPSIQEENGVKVSVTKERKRVSQSEEKEKAKCKITDTRRRSTHSEKNSSTGDNVQIYSLSRRLTRRQKLLLEKNLENKPEIHKTRETSYTENEAISSDGSDSSSSDEMDRINLLDKSDFQGEKDVEERKSLRSSLSSIAESSVSMKGKKTKKSASSRSRLSSPPKPKLRSTRSQSNASSIVSLPSSTPSPKLKKKAKASQESTNVNNKTNVERTKRGKASSVISVITESTTPARRRRLRSTSDLPKIIEEGENQTDFKQRLRSRNKQ